MFLGGGVQCWGKWSKVVGSGRGVDVRALEDFGRTAEQVPGPSQVGATAPETLRSNSPTRLLPQCCRNGSHSQELRAAAHVTGALFTSRRRTRSRDACWDVLISCSRCRAARRHDMTAKDKPLRKRKRSDVESVQGVSEVVTEPHPRRDSALHAVHCMSGPVHARRCSLCHGNTAGCSPRHHRALPDGHGVYGGFPSGMDHPF